MAEFKLICPGCDAEYTLPRDAIPSGGREVECSSCGHVWQAHPPSAPDRLDLGSFSRPPAAAIADPGIEDDDEAPRPIPPARQRLSPDVLDMLRDEVEHERRLREAETPPRPQITAPASIGHPDDDIEWPATTVTLPAQTARAVTPMAQPPLLPDMPQQTPSVIRHGQPRPVPALPQRPVPQPERPLPQPTHPIPVQQTKRPEPDRTGRRGYGWGFSLALLLTAGVLATYLLAPVLADRGGPLAGPLMAAREALDQVRFWLAGQLGRLTGG